MDSDRERDQWEQEQKRREDIAREERESDERERRRITFRPATEPDENLLDAQSWRADFEKAFDRMCDAEARVAQLEAKRDEWVGHAATAAQAKDEALAERDWLLDALRSGADCGETAAIRAWCRRTLDAHLRPECQAMSWQPEGRATCRGPAGHEGGHVWEVQ